MAQAQMLLSHGTKLILKDGYLFSPGRFVSGLIISKNILADALILMSHLSNM